MDTLPEPTFDQDLSMVVAQLPASIRAFFTNGEVEVITKKMIQKHRLQAGQGAIVERELILLLLGLTDPTEVSNTLSVDAKLDRTTIESIVQDLEEQIFAHQRNQAPTVLSTPAPRVAPQQVQMPIYSAPPLQSPRYVRADEEVVAFKSAPLPPKVAMPAAKPPPAATPASNLEAKPPSVQIVPEMKALPVGETEPRVVPPPIPTVPQPALVVSVPAQALVQPNAAPAEPKLLLADPSTALPEQKAFVTPPVPVRPPSADDPYREPIDLN